MTFFLPTKNIFEWDLVLNGSKILAFREPFLPLFAENLCGKFPCGQDPWKQMLILKPLKHILNLEKKLG